MKKIETTIKEILEESFWPEDIIPGICYARTQDDCDGDLSQQLSIIFSHDGDAWVNTHVPLLRFRMPLIGGGLSPRVRNGLLILAMAIKMDNETNPIGPH